MTIIWINCLILLVNIVYCNTAIIDDEEIVVKLLGGPRKAKELADELGFIYNGPVSYYVFAM